MSKHDHVPPTVCEHDLKFCRPCLAVYCTTCDSEWVGPCTKPHRPEALTWLQQYAVQPAHQPWMSGRLDGAIPMTARESRPVTLTDAYSRTHVGHQ